MELAERYARGLTIALAVLAAIVATGLIAGLQMWPWIVLYWCAVTAKNALDALRSGGRKK